jgi:hypothetical protein
MREPYQEGCEIAGEPLASGFRRLRVRLTAAGAQLA